MVGMGGMAPPICVPVYAIRVFERLGVLIVPVCARLQAYVKVGLCVGRACVRVAVAFCGSGWRPLASITVIPAGAPFEACLLYTSPSPRDRG